MPKKITIIAILIVSGGISWGVLATSNPHSWTNSLVGYWSFDGQHTTSTAGTRDVSNNSNWGTFYGGVKPIGGISGQALSFDGTNDYMEVADSASLDIADTITVEMWLNPTSAQVGAEIAALSKREAYEVYFDHSNTSFRGCFVLVGNAAWQHCNGPVSIPQNTWSHFVGVYDGNALLTYINGVLKSSNVIGAVSIATNNNPLYLAQDYVASPLFNGLIDEVRIYSRALSADEVKQHYDQTRRNLKINQLSGTPPVAWWKMDEGTGQTVRNYSANTNDCTVSNGGYGVTSTDGQIGKALIFDGSNDYLGCGDSTALRPGSTSKTIELWVKRITNTGGYQGLISKGDLYGTFRGNYYLFFYNNAILANYQNASYTTWAGAAPAVGIWTHLVLVADHSTDQLTLYRNGVSLGTVAQTMDTSNFNNTQFIIGCLSQNGVNYFGNNIIDDVRVYNYVRTADQITSDYRAGAYRTIVNSSVPSSWWTNGLVGYWSFDGKYTTSTVGTRDVSNNGNWGTFSGGVKPTAGIVGQAISFDGVNDYIDAGNGASLNFGTGDFSIEAWIYPTGTAGSDYFVTKDDGTAVNQIALRVATATGLVGGWIGGTSFNGTIDTRNTWHHIVVTRASGAVKMYDNAVQDAFFTGAGSVSHVTRTLKIGCYVDGLGSLEQFFQGKIDEVRIYNRALSADEIMQHYQQTRRNLGL